MNKETKLQAKILRTMCTIDGVDMCRNNVGMSVVLPKNLLARCRGAAATGGAPAVLAVLENAFKSADRVQYGLAKGSSDLIGQVDGRFCSIEIKTADGTLSKEQAQWLRRVRFNKGFAAVVRSEKDAKEAIERCKKGLFE